MGYNLKYWGVFIIFAKCKHKNDQLKWRGSTKGGTTRQWKDLGRKHTQVQIHLYVNNK